MFEIIVPWLLVSNITLLIIVICGAPLLWSLLSFTNPLSAMPQSVLTPTVIKCSAVLILILCITIPLHFYAEGQRPVTITPDRSWNTTQIQNITSISNDQRWSMEGGGSFFLGCGEVSVNGGSSQEYTFYKVTPNGYQLGTLDATNVFIKEDENKYPYIEWDYSHYTTPLKRWDDDGSVDKFDMNGETTDKLMITYIHVPNGTIIKDYSLGGK
jgi:hypothetical protein